MGFFPSVQKLAHAQSLLGQQSLFEKSDVDAARASAETIRVAAERRAAELSVQFEALRKQQHVGVGALVDEQPHSQALWVPSLHETKTARTCSVSRWAASFLLTFLSLTPSPPRFANAFHRPFLRQ